MNTNEGGEKIAILLTVTDFGANKRRMDDPTKKAMILLDLANHRRWIMAEGLATRSSRGHRTICLPIAEESYCRVVDDPAAFRVAVDDGFRDAPELFPRRLRPRLSS